MTEKDVLSIFKKENAFLTGHFLLSSGLHSPNYMQCALVLQKPAVAEKLCKELAKKLKGVKIDVVVGPALGGMIVSYEMGRALKVRSIFAERVDGQFAFRRGFSLKRGERVLVVEDVITTGKSSYEVIDLVNQCGAQVVAVASLVDRSDGAAVFQQEFFALMKMQIRTYKPEECPLCREKKIPLTKPGSRGLRATAAAVLFLFAALCGPAFAEDQAANVNYDQVRQDYRAYLQQLKKMNSQYKEITGEMAKIMKEEGFPTWDSDIPGLPEVNDPAVWQGDGYSVQDAGKELVVSIDLPGLKKDSIHVSLSDQKALRVRGARKAENRQIERVIELPQAVSEKNTHARYEDGVLTVRLTKISPSGGDISIPVR